MNYEMEWIWKEAVMLFTKYCLDDQIYENDVWHNDCRGYETETNKSVTVKPAGTRPWMMDV
jgi:hypothetical protein